MLSSFWRRKNGRLVQRLNAAIEASERLSEAYNAPKPPRVVIDTSYVERRSRQPTIAHPYDDTQFAPEPGDTDAPQEANGFDGHPDLGPDVSTTNGADYGGPNARHGDDDALDHARDGDTQPEALAGDIALIREAVEQLELAEQREAEALQELEAARRRTEELEAAVATEQAARSAAESLCTDAKKAAEEAAGELAALRSAPAPLVSVTSDETDARARLEADLMHEQAARREAEAQRDKAQLDLKTATDEIDVLRKTAEELASAKTATADTLGDDEARETNAALQSRNEELAAEAARTREALARVEADLKSARKVTDTARKEAADLRADATRATEAEQELAHANAREAEAATRIQGLEKRVQELETRIADVSSELESERDASTQKLQDATDEIAALRLVAEQIAEARAKEGAEARQRENALVKEVDTLKLQVADLETSLNAERETAHKAAERSLEEISALRRTAEELTDSKASENGQAEQRISDALAQVEALREEIAKHEEILATERASAEKTAAASAAEIAALRQASEELAESHARDTAEDAKKLEELRRAFDDERQRADTLATSLTEAEAARLSAEFDRDSARQAADEAATRLAALRHRLPPQSPSPGFAIAEPPVLRSSASAAAVAAVTAAGDTVSRAASAADRARRIELLNNAALAGEPDPAQPVAQIANQITDEPLETAANHNGGELTHQPASEHTASNVEEPEIATPPAEETGTTDTQNGALHKETEATPLALLPPPLPTTTPVIEQPTPHAPEMSDTAVDSGNLPNAPTHAGDTDRRDREKRIPSSMAVTLWTELWGQPLSCFLVDKSSRGAKIEMKPDRIFGGNNRINVGDRLTLTFYYAQERTSVFCDVMWMNGNFLGVKYYGQFHTELNKPRHTQRRRFGGAE